MAGREDDRDRDRRDPTEGFLSRWSRRKREEPEAAPPVPAIEAAAPAEPDDRPRDPETGELIDEDLVAKLPDIAEITPGADLSAFMQRGVPEALRRRALRAMWESDPVIRDFVSPALDYAYDYNAPGGAPGYGPLTESDMAQARDLISKLFSDADLPDRKPKNAQSAQDGDNESQPAPDLALNPVRQADVAAQDRTENDEASDLTKSVKTRNPVSGGGAMAESAVVQRSNDAASEIDGKSAETGVGMPRRRRGGGATPV